MERYINELARFSSNDRQAYQNSLKYYRDLKNVLDTAFEEGLERGLEQGEYKRSIDVARCMKAAGEPTDRIVLFTGLTASEIEMLRAIVKHN
jgi:hypothetical protein